MDELISNFAAIDWVIVTVYLAGTVAIGLYVNRYIKDMDDYVVAGRTLKSYASIATMVGSELGLVTVMYAAQKGFTGGFAAFHIGLVAGIVTLIVGLTGFIVVPLRELEVMTIPGFYSLRFGRGVQVYGGLLLAFAGILNMGMFLKAGALFVGGLTGLTNDTSVNLIMSVLLIIVLIYTILGGMVSVVVTDYIQFVVLSFGLLITCWFAYSNLGWDQIVEGVKTIHGAPGFDPFRSEGFGLSYIIWMLFAAGLVSCAVWQTAVMRACSVENLAIVKRMYIWSSIGFLIRFMIPQFLGVCALAYFWNKGIPLADFFTPEMKINPDQSLNALPVFLSQILPVGLIGLIGAGMLAAFMSTHDSYLLCWASVLTQDVVSPIFGDRISTKNKLFLTRCFIFGIGIFLLIWGLWYPLGQDLWDYMAVSGAIYFTGAFAVLLLGLYWKPASTTGAYLALTAGSLNVLSLKPVKTAIALPEKFNGLELSSANIGLATTVLAILLMIAGSLLVPNKANNNRRIT